VFTATYIDWIILYLKCCIHAL